MPVVSPADFAPAADFLPALLDLLPAGVVGYLPVVDARGEVVDFAFAYLNPAARRMMGLPAQFAATYLQQWPSGAASGSFAFFRDTFQAGTPAQRDQFYQADGQGMYLRAHAVRLGAGLLVTFTNAADQPRTAVEEALRASQARERAARAEAERQRNWWQNLVDKAPVAIGMFEGPELRIAMANHLMTTVWGRSQAEVLGRPLLVAVPELTGQGFEKLMQQVRETGAPVARTEAPAQLLRHGQLTTSYYNSVFQPFSDEQGQVVGVLDVAVEVTEQVLARHLLEEKERQAHLLNEELQAANAEIRAKNAEQAHTQQALRHLNEELEARVAERTRQLETQQALLRQMLTQVPAAVATLLGPEHRYAFFNDQYLALTVGRAALGRSVAEVLPEVVEQGFIELLDRVYATGRPFMGTETLLLLHDQATGQDVQRYVDFSYQPLTDGGGRTQGILAFILDVTDRVRARKQAETLQAAALAAVQRQAQQRQEIYEIFAQTPVAIVLLREPNHSIDYFNAAFKTLFPPEEWAGPLRGHTLAEVYPRIKLAGLVALLDRVFATGEPQVVIEMPLAELQLGSPRYVTFSYQAYYEQGRIAGVAAFAYDVTDQVLTRRQADALQAALLAVAQRRAQERQDLLSLFERAPVGVVLLREPEHRIEYFNALFAELYPGAPLRGRRLAEAYPVAATPKVLAQLDHVYQTGELCQRVEVPLAGALAPRYVTLTCQAYRENDRITGVALFVHEVTEQVLARQAREAQLTELRRIFEQAPVAIVIMRGPALVVELANEAVGAIWGRPPAQVLGRPYFEAVSDTAGQGIEAILASVMATGQPTAITEAPVQLARAHTGRPTLGYFNFVFQPLYDDQDRVSGLIAIGTEVTDQVLARQQVQAANEELHRSNTQLNRINVDLDTFVYSASHDLKSPITNIEGLLLLLRQQLPPEALRGNLMPRLLDMMDGAVTRFQQTLGHLTDVSRLPQEMASQPVEAVDLPALAESVRLDILPELTAAGVTLTLDLAACPTLYFPAKTLRSILYNLLSNAVKYRDPARPALVQLRCHCQPGQVVLEVQDNGLGLNAAQQRELFQLFRRLHAHVSGAGVGLYMVKKMVDNAGGTLAVESQPGEGSTFTVVLPVAAPPS